MNITDGSKGRMSILCPHCKKELDKRCNVFFEWFCIDHGKIYFFYNNALTETENSKKLYNALSEAQSLVTNIDKELSR